MAKFIKCDYCGKKIRFGEKVYTDENADGIYCSCECYGMDNAYEEIVDEDLINDFYWAVYDDDVRKAEIQKEMEEHQKAIEKLFEEFKSLTIQN